MSKKSLLIVVFMFVVCGADAQILHYDRPAEYFEESLVLGNGTLGGIIYGGTYEDVISLNDIRLWTGEPSSSLPKFGSDDNAKALKDIRQALENENYPLAESLQKQLQGHYSENYQPLGTLKIQYLGKNDEITGYQRFLDIGCAKVETTYKRNGFDFRTSYFCSAPDKVMVVRLQSKSPIFAKIILDSQQPHENKIDGNEIVSDGYAAYHSLPHYLYANQYFWYDESRGIHYRTVVKAISKNVVAESDGLLIKGAKDVLILVSNETSFAGFDKNPANDNGYKNSVRKNIDAATDKGFSKLLSSHIKDYQSFYNRVSINLGRTADEIKSLPIDVQLKRYSQNNESNPELEALYFQYGRYLLISCSRTPDIPATLQGLWNEKMLPPWSSNYTCNINLEENYWPAEVANLSEMHLPLFGFLKNISKTGEFTAKNIYGVDEGWCLAHNSDVWAMTNPVGANSGDPSWACWNMGGAWLSTHIWEHYAFTQDKDFLREYYPILKGAAQFCMNWMVEKDGTLMTSPSTSPENFYITDEGFRGATFYGGTADMAMIRECLADTRKSAVELGIDADFCEKIDSISDKILPYRISRNGNLQEWFHDWRDADPQHRHQSHLFGLYPGNSISSQTDLLNACARTLEVKGDESTGWSTGWRINLYARLHNSEKTYHFFRRLLKYISPDLYSGADAVRGGGTYPNLLDAHSPFQIDGNFGGCAGLAEMLVQSDGKTIYLLPCLPQEWKSGNVKGLCARGGFVVDIEWENCTLKTYSVYSRAGNPVNVLCGDYSASLDIEKGQKITVKVSK